MLVDKVKTLINKVLLLNPHIKINIRKNIVVKFKIKYNEFKSNANFCKQIVIPLCIMQIS